MTSLQLRTLKMYLWYRGKRLSALGLFKSNIRAYLILLLIFGALAAWCYWFFGVVGASLVSVAGLTVLLRDFGFYRRTARIWPILQDVLDWSKIESLVAANDHPPA
jgi:hypothetical protein